jgi:hypothetical protein
MVGVIIRPLQPQLTHSGSVKDPPPNETIRGINMDVCTEEEADEVLATLNRIAMAGKEVADDGGGGGDDDDDDDDDDDRTGEF